MSETFARDCQVNQRMDTTNLFTAAKKTVNEKGSSEPFAREVKNVKGGHQVLDYQPA